jgi:hypothetical protein
MPRKEAGIAVRQVEDEEVGLLLDTINDDVASPKSAWASPGGCASGTNTSRPRPLSLPHVILDDRVAAGEPVLLAQPVIHALGGMALLGAGPSVPVQPRVDDLGEPVQLRALDRSLRR